MACEFYLSFHFDDNSDWRRVKVIIEIDLKVHVRTYRHLAVLSVAVRNIVRVSRISNTAKIPKFRTDIQQIRGTRRLLAGRLWARFPMVSMEILN